VSLATSFSPLAALLIAMVLLGEDPGPGLIPGGLIILLAIGLGQYGRMRAKKASDAAAQDKAKSDSIDKDDMLEQESRVNFKGA